MPYCLVVFAQSAWGPLFVLYQLIFVSYEGVRQRQPFLLSAGEHLFFLLVSFHSRDGEEVVKR